MTFNHKRFTRDMAWGVVITCAWAYGFAGNENLVLLGFGWLITMLIVGVFYCTWKAAGYGIGEIKRRYWRRV